MKALVIAAALLATGSGVARAQDAATGQAPARTQTDRTAAPSTPQARISVKTTPVSEIIKNPAAKAILEKAFPEIAQYYDMIGANTLTEVIPLSGGAMTEAQVAAVQLEFDKL